MSAVRVICLAAAVPSARTTSTATKLAIPTQGRRIVTLATVPKSHARSATPETPTM
jgi:hypothetical protein